MFEQTFKNIDDILHKDAGCGSELDYVEQTSWVLFLKYLDDLERDKETAAELTGKTYTPIIAKEFQWNVWAAPKITNGNGIPKIDHNALTGDRYAAVLMGRVVHIITHTADGVHALYGLGVAFPGEVIFPGHIPWDSPAF